MEKPLTMEEIYTFTYQSYVRLLNQLKKIYKIIPFHELPQKPPYIILRHDVDFSLSAALKMAQIEHGLGIRSTYFILFTSDFYNIFDKENICIIKNISKLGHEVGLHYDPSHFKINGLKPIEILKMQIKVLESITGKSIKSIVRHGPWTDRDPFAAIKGYINADHPYYLGDLGIHDSLKIWTPPDGLVKLFEEQPKRVQILIHPENWTETNVNRELTLRRLFSEIYNKYRHLKEEIGKTWFNCRDVLDYYHLADVLKNKRLDIKKNRNTVRNFLKNFMNNLKYYKKCCDWYLINSKKGWQIHLVLEDLRKTLSRCYGDLYVEFCKS